jgi:hypothetical protein
MVRRALALALIGVFAALVASPWFACGGWQATPDDCCAMMGDASQPDAAIGCCAMKEAAGGGAQAAAVHENGAVVLVLLASPDPGVLVPDLIVVTAVGSAEPTADTSPFPSLHVPLRI